MIRQIVEGVFSSKKIRIATISAMVLLSMTAILISLMNIHPDNKWQLYQLPLSIDNHANIINNQLYSYNGIVFTKTDLESKRVTILLEGIRLPAVSGIWWADDHGVLVKFNSSFYNTEVFDQILDNYEIIEADSIINYLWYVDFSSGLIKLVSDSPLIDRSPYYDRGSGQIFYSVLTSSADESKSLTYSLDIKSKDIRVASSRFPLVSVAHSIDCENYINCLIGKTDTREGLSIFGFTGESYTLIMKDDQAINISPTNNNNIYYATYDNNRDIKEEYTDKTSNMFEVEIWDISSKTKKGTGLKISDASNLVSIYEDGLYALYYPSIDNKSTTLVERANSLLGIKSNIRKGRFDEPISGLVSYDKQSGSILLYQTSGKLAILSKDTYESIVSGSFDDKLKKASDCAEENDTIAFTDQDDYSNIINISIPFNEGSLSDEVYRNISNCISKNAADFIDVKFTLFDTPVDMVSRDPLTGLPTI